MHPARRWLRCLRQIRHSCTFFFSSGPRSTLLQLSSYGIVRIVSKLLSYCGFTQRRRIASLVLRLTRTFYRSLEEEWWRGRTRPLLWRSVVYCLKWPKLSIGHASLPPASITLQSNWKPGILSVRNAPVALKALSGQATPVP